MKKVLFWSGLLLILGGLMACAPETTNETAETDGESSGGTTGTTISESSEPIDVTGDFPASTFEAVVNERTVDHAKGAEDPILTVIEYGDFQ